jgi:putative hydrolase of the HAD superfamily
MKIHWHEIETVFLDMDGTLLDLRFDNYFWLEHLPRRYAEMRGMKVSRAKRELLEKYRRVEGTMEWYCLDYWTRELGMDIPILKEEIDHLIAVHPYVPEFLDWVRAQGKRVVLVTNAHGQSLHLKMQKTRLADRFDAILSAHDLGLPKEEVSFWKRLQKVEPFRLGTTLLVDDNEAVLRSAQEYGIRHLVAVLRPDTTRPAKVIQGFPAMQSFRDLVT